MDSYRFRIECTKEGQHQIGVEYTDLAGNRAESTLSPAFIIDTQLPEIKIAGVVDGSANAGDLLPIISVQDANLAADSTVIAVTTGTGKSVTVAKEVTAGTVKISNHQNQEETIYNNCTEFTYQLTDISEKEDDVYYLTVTSSDLAGNQQTQTLWHMPAMSSCRGLQPSRLNNKVQLGQRPHKKTGYTLSDRRESREEP